MRIQLVIVIVILITAISFAAFRIYKALTHKGDGCYGCPLKDACEKQRRRPPHHEGFSGNDPERAQDKRCPKQPLP